MGLNGLSTPMVAALLLLAAGSYASALVQLPGAPALRPLTRLYPGQHFNSDNLIEF
jgi:hypothetical protein